MHTHSGPRGRAWRRTGLAILLAGAALALALLRPAWSGAATETRFFPETGHSVSGEFLGYWQANGGLRIFGYPISDVVSETDPTSGRVLSVQWFERARFELHPENAPAYRVELGLLGRQLYQAQAAGPGAPQIAISAGGAALTIAPDETALVPAGAGELVVSVSYPAAAFQPDFSVVVHQLSAGTPWQLAPSGRMPVAGSHLFALRGAADSPSYIQVEVRQGAGRPAVFFGVQQGAAPASAPALIASWRDPVALVGSYYNAINRQEYQRAYSYWEQPGAPGAVQASYSDFARGYADTAAVEVVTGAPLSDVGAGNLHVRVPVVVTTTRRDGATARYYGFYAVHGVNVDVGDTTPPYPLALETAKILPAPAGADPAALLRQAQALAQQS